MPLNDLNDEKIDSATLAPARLTFSQLIRNGRECSLNIYICMPQDMYLYRLGEHCMGATNLI